MQVPISVGARLALLPLLLGACQVWTVNPGPVPPKHCNDAGPVTHSVYLIGDAGAPELPDEDVPELVDTLLLNLQADVAASAEALGADNVGVIFLGDNVYFRGLVPPGESDRRRGERVLEAQMAAAEPAHTVFMAGNHDWEIQGPKGWEHVTAQREFLAEQGPRVHMLPPGGCSGPEVRDFGPYLRFVFVDLIGFSHALQFPDEHRDCRHPDARSAYLDMAEQFENPEGHHTVLALHHPLITAGPHGGHYTWKQHLFPLTDFWPWAWFPLPVIGSAYPLSRQLGVTGTDLSNEHYQQWIRGIYRASTTRAPMLIAAGHEHSLQVHRDALGLYYAVSGAGSKMDRVEKMDTEMMALARPGYMRLDSHQDGDLGLTVLALLDGDDPREPVFRHCLVDGRPPSRP